METLGIRNNNPANIRRNVYQHWKGQSKVQTNAFVRFDSMEYGVRALFITLHTYTTKYKLSTIQSIISRWAPESDGNNTFAYIKFVQMRYYQALERNQKEFRFSNSALLREDSLVDIPRCFFRNKKSPTFICREIAKAMCEIESHYILTDLMIDKAIALI